METKRDKILEKLRKLMNLKESAKALGNEGEAHAAAAGIARLLMEYNLSEEDIPEQEKLENPVIAEEIPYKVEMSNCVWYNFLVSTVCEYNMCRSLIVSRPKNYRMVRDKFQIIGRKKNVEVVLYLISFLAHQFVIIWKRKYPNYKYECIRKYGITPKTLAMYMKSFLYGCVIGLGDKFASMKQGLEETSNVTALVVASKAEIDEFLKNEKIGNARESQAQIDRLCAKEGINVGRNIEIQKGIHAESVSEDRRLM